METQKVPEATFNRAEAIEQIREKLWSETRDNECACAATARLCCDVETREHCACDGWNGFHNEQLEDLYRALTGRQATVGR